MTEMVKAAVLSAPEQIEVREFPKPTPRDGAFLLRMEMVGICGTDKHSYKGESKLYAGTEIESDINYPIIPGHEPVGVVAEMDGPRKDYYGVDLKVGDRVYFWPDVICGCCPYCRDVAGYGFPWCEHTITYGVTMSCAEPPHLFGGWAEYVYITPQTFVYKVPEDLPVDVAVLAELMSVFYRLDETGDTVVVQGIGPLGLCQVAKAALMGAGDIVAVDHSPYRLELAKEFGATHTINVEEMPSTERIKFVKGLTGGRGADMVVEAAGVPQAVIEGIEMLRRGGQFIEMGNYVDMGEVPINPHRHLCAKAIRLFGVSNHPYKEIGPVLKWLRRHMRSVDFSRMISHRFALEQVKQALEVSMQLESMKVVLVP